MHTFAPASETEVIENICSLNWAKLSKDSLIDAAWAYYFFSIQFRENLKVARQLYPDDLMLRELEEEECATLNLTPWPHVALPGERMDHDEFMRRSLALTAIDGQRRARLYAHGSAYLEITRGLDPTSRALSMASYEGGGLERVFRAMLTAPDWSSPLLEAFRHFLSRHLQLDSHHSELVGHLESRHDTAPLWTAFRELLLNCVPDLMHEPRTLDGLSDVQDLSPVRPLSERHDEAPPATAMRRTPPVTNPDHDISADVAECTVELAAAS